MASRFSEAAVQPIVLRRKITLRSDPCEPVLLSSALLGIGAIALRFPTETEGRGLTALESFDVSRTSFSIFAVERRQKTHESFCPSFMRKVICLWITRSS